MIRVSKKGVLVPNLVDFVKQTTQAAEEAHGAKKQLAFLVSASPDAASTGRSESTLVRADEDIAISNYDLSSIVTCSRVCYALEEIWNVL